MLSMGLDELFSAIQNSRTIQDHPDWAQFKARKLPQYVSFYYTNQDGQEAYWDQARIIKIDLKKMLLIVEGAHGDPLKFDIFKIMHCKDAKTGEKAQDIFFDLVRMWNDTYQPSE
jgi:hypothetical protein